MDGVALERFDRPLFVNDATPVLSRPSDLAPPFDAAFSIFNSRRLERLSVPHPVHVRDEIFCGPVGGKIKIAVSEAIVRRIRVTSIDFYKLLVELRRKFFNGPIVKRTYAFSGFLI